ncbi:hypothetical protein [Micromonospora inositola]|uniref:Uncharacterized protein n=1 Tax=Micromonospora inositola TaxID=47865 RepID=A0A1C5GYT0_9ACTN|nr:hypothetical protein [Micromonospora inositola]SCG38311.1 hypothetical protein GA0070613_0508 [Micromonospora inositola]
MADRLDVDPPELLRLARRLTEVAELLAATRRPDADELPAGPTGRAPVELAELWLDELPRAALDLHELAGLLRAVATAVAAVDERLAARLARLGTDRSDDR